MRALVSPHANVRASAVASLGCPRTRLADTLTGHRPTSSAALAQAQNRVFAAAESVADVMPHGLGPETTKLVWRE